ncbi:MAG TPA: hypothetical protein DC024_12730 [Clostridiales bacterium]|mgnify:CR=1 FL=1|nr:hypothetical protein [Clostridiales bacterium]
MKTSMKLIVSILIMSVMFIGIGSAEPSDLSEDNFTEGEFYLPDYGPSIFEKLKDNPDVIETRGVMLEITDDKEKVKWLDTIETSIRSSKDKLEPYMQQYGGPVIGFGINYEGYLFVEFDKKLEDTINKSTMDELYNIIEVDAKKMEISNVPVVFRSSEGEILESRTSTWTNLIGGIRLQGGNEYSTLSFAAKKDSSGKKGFVMSGHAAINAGGIGAAIYQPNTPRQVGTVNYYNYVFADAAWVEASNVVDDVYYQDINQLKDVADHGDTTKGHKVYKSGITTGLTNGTVVDTYIIMGTLQDQFTATYWSEPGDSGAPVFILSGDTVELVGVHKGRWGSNAAFSPMSGVRQELGITPLTT